jgi:hypothetical protein
MDLALATLPWKIILGLQMRRTEKFGVALAMSMGVAYVQPRSFYSICLGRD